MPSLSLVGGDEVIVLIRQAADNVGQWRGFPKVLELKPPILRPVLAFKSPHFRPFRIDTTNT